MGRGRNKLIMSFLLWTILVSVSAAWTGPVFAKIYSVPQHNIEDSNLIRSSEGFGLENNVPGEVVEAWNSVFVFYIDTPVDPDFGSAFLVEKIDRGSTVDMYFLTNEHVVRKYCPGQGRCQSAILKQNMRMNYNDGGEAFHAELNVTAFYNITVVSRSVSPDLALLKVSTSKAVADRYEPLAIGSCQLFQGQPLYAIGFPNVTRRPNPGVVIERSKFVTKRWSAGVYVIDRKDKDAEGITHELIATSVDAMGGSSGGPILNAAGEVVGVMKNSSSLKTNGQAYFGRDHNPNDLNWHSNGVRCDHIKYFIDRSPK